MTFIDLDIYKSLIKHTSGRWIPTLLVSFVWCVIYVILVFLVSLISVFLSEFLEDFVVRIIVALISTMIFGVTYFGLISIPYANILHPEKSVFQNFIESLTVNNIRRALFMGVVYEVIVGALLLGTYIVESLMGLALITAPQFIFYFMIICRIVALYIATRFYYTFANIPAELYDNPNAKVIDSFSNSRVTMDGHKFALFRHHVPVFLVWLLALVLPVIFVFATMGFGGLMNAINVQNKIEASAELQKATEQTRKASNGKDDFYRLNQYIKQTDDNTKLAVYRPTPEEAVLLSKLSQLKFFIILSIIIILASIPIFTAIQVEFCHKLTEPARKKKAELDAFEEEARRKNNERIANAAKYNEARRTAKQNNALPDDGRYRSIAVDYSSLVRSAKTEYDYSKVENKDNDAVNTTQKSEHSDANVTQQQDTKQSEDKVVSVRERKLSFNGSFDFGLDDIKAEAEKPSSRKLEIANSVSDRIDIPSFDFNALTEDLHKTDSKAPATSKEPAIVNDEKTSADKAPSPAVPIISAPKLDKQTQAAAPKVPNLTADAPDENADKQSSVNKRIEDLKPLSASIPTLSKPLFSINKPASTIAKKEESTPKEDKTLSTSIPLLNNSTEEAEPEVPILPKTEAPSLTLSNDIFANSPSLATDSDQSSETTSDKETDIFANSKFNLDNDFSLDNDFKVNSSLDFGSSTESSFDDIFAKYNKS